MQTISFDVNDMICGGCAEQVRPWSKSKHKHRDRGRAAVVAAVGSASGASMSGTGSATAPISREDGGAQLHLLQAELVKLQRHVIGCGDKILVLVEALAAGKDGGLKRVIEFQPGPAVAFEFTPDCITVRRLARRVSRRKESS
jgi:polyphosphate kinase 2 (PPK2 family)